MINELKGIIHNDALTINGKTIGENCKDAPCYDRKVIKTVDNPVKTHAGSFSLCFHSLFLVFYYLI